jgi:ferredoxin--NADP+ reductase
MLMTGEHGHGGVAGHTCRSLSSAENLAMELVPKILEKRELVKGIFEMEVAAPNVATKAKAGQFVVVIPDDIGERIPLTLADWDCGKGTITLIFMVVGASTAKLSKMSTGQSLHAVTGPLGHPSEIEDFGEVVLVAGGVGTAPVYPIAKAFKEKGVRVVSIQGARTKDLLFWQDKLASVSDEHIVTTDDGSFARKGLVTEPLKELLERDTGKVKCVYAIGPGIMMKFCAKTTQPFGVRTIVSLNPIMVDATGMCGVCRVSVGGKTKFGCVDGPEFDGHQVDWDLLVLRQRTYLEQEKLAMERFNKGGA